MTVPAADNLYRICVLGPEHVIYFPDLLEAMTFYVDAKNNGLNRSCMTVQQWVGESDWLDFDPEQFLDGLARLIAPVKYDLYSYDTAAKIGPATAEQTEASLAAGDTGTILIDSDGAVIAAGSWEAQQPGVIAVYVVKEAES